MNQEEKDQVFLLKPTLRGKLSLEASIKQRQSVREFSNKGLKLFHISQILWSAKMVPSAGALYPLDFYLVVGEVEGLQPGVYYYHQNEHKLKKIKGGDQRKALVSACWGQSFVAQAPTSVVITAEYERTTQKYGQRGVRYVHMEAGHSAQNIYLQVTALGLGTVAVGAFDDEEVKKVLSLSDNHQPLYIMPIGYPL
jgi:SagB-type dehydrogenase family enzyme